YFTVQRRTHSYFPGRPEAGASEHHLGHRAAFADQYMVLVHYADVLRGVAGGIGGCSDDRWLRFHGRAYSNRAAAVAACHDDDRVVYRGRTMECVLRSADLLE